MGTRACGHEPVARAATTIALAGVTLLVALALLGAANTRAGAQDLADEPAPVLAIPDDQPPAVLVDITDGVPHREPRTLLVVDSLDRPIWTNVGGPWIFRCADASCGSVERSPLDPNNDDAGLLIDALLTDSGGNLVLVAGAAETQAELQRATIRRCVSGPLGFCDPNTSLTQTIEASQTGFAPEPPSDEIEFNLIDAVIDAQDRPVLLITTGREMHLWRCADPLCAEFQTLPVPLADDLIYLTYRGEIVLSPDDRPFIAFDSYDEAASQERRADREVVMVACVDPLCAQTEVNRFETPSGGFPLNLLGVQMAPGENARPVLVVQLEREMHILDCETFDCPTPQSSLLRSLSFTYYSPPPVLMSSGGQPVVIDLGVVIVCEDAGCSGARSTEPVHERSTMRAAALTSDDRPVIITTDGLVLCGGLQCRRPTDTTQARFSISCTRRAYVSVFNLGDEAVTYEFRSGSGSRQFTMAGRQTSRTTSQPIHGRPDGPVVMILSRDGVDVASRAVSMVCDGGSPFFLARTTCINETGRVDVSLAATAAELPRTLEVSVGNVTRQVTLTTADLGRYQPRIVVNDEASGLATVSSRRDGTYDVTVRDIATDRVVHTQTVTVDCSDEDPVDPVIEPTPEPIDENPAVSIVTSCLQNNGRIDTTIVEQTNTTAVWTITVDGLSPRTRTIAPGDWWRMPVTGRPDGNYSVQILRNGVAVMNPTVAISCDAGQEQLSDPEVTVTSACRNERGYILYQFINNNPDPKSWVLEFQGVPNRSTSAPGFATSVKAVTGRPNGTYTWNIRGQQTQTIVVDC